jgi:hypothetical protein
MNGLTLIAARRTRSCWALLALHQVQSSVERLRHLCQDLRGEGDTPFNLFNIVAWAKYPNVLVRAISNGR